ncbi:hypothetical protein C4D60_Mb02t06520 [Musa balbisiana]|uniref:Uncharacterized protein n=1 Tax=Musa balbisiana TaxID=52838 RepID=A0A4S8I8P8_MUSBA|nr:hypothetical protein C4D60_Mb02t06520 [Musa balbisiana]
MSYTLTPSTLKSEVGVSPPTCRLPPVTTSKANTSPGHGEEQCDGLRSCGLPWHTETIPFRFHFLSLISTRLWCYKKAVLLEPATTMTFDPFIAFGFVGFIVWMLVSDVQTTNLVVCTYPRTPALALGLLAAVALMIAQAIIKTVSGVTFIIPFVLLLSGECILVNAAMPSSLEYFQEARCYPLQVLPLALYIMFHHLEQRTPSPGMHNKIKASHWAILIHHPRLNPLQDRDDLFLKDKTLLF